MKKMRSERCKKILYRENEERRKGRRITTVGEAKEEGKELKMG